MRWKRIIQVLLVLSFVGFAFSAKEVSVEYLVKKGYAYMQSGKLEEAKSAFMQALESDPTSSDAVKGLAQVFVKKGEVEEGVNYFKGLIEKDAQNANAHFGLGYLNLLRGERFYDDAIASFKLALLSDAHFEDAYTCLASIYLHRKLYGQSAELLERALFMLPSSDTIYTQLWYSYYKLWDECCKGGDEEGAKFAFSKLTQLPKMREQARLGISPAGKEITPEEEPAPSPAQVQAPHPPAPQKEEVVEGEKTASPQAPQEAPAKEEVKTPAQQESAESPPMKEEGLEGLVVSFADGVAGIVLGKGLLDESKDWQIEIFDGEKSLGKFAITKSYSSTLSIKTPSPLQKGDAITLLQKLAVNDGDEGIVREIFSQGFVNVDITKNTYLKGTIKATARRVGESLFEGKDVEIENIGVVIEFFYPEDLPPLSSGMRVVFHSKGEGEGK